MSEAKLLFSYAPPSNFASNFNLRLYMTAAAFDGGLRRLITGASDGTMRMWNFSNGQMLKVGRCKLRRVELVLKALETKHVIFLLLTFIEPQGASW